MTSRSSLPHQPSRIIGEHGDRVGVEHERHVARSSSARTNSATSARAAEAGSAGDHVVASARARDRPPPPSPCPCHRPAVGSVMNSGRHRRDDRQARRRRRHGHQAGAGAQRAHRRQIAPRRSCPVDPATSVTRPKSPLCESAARGSTSAAQLLRRQQLDVRAFERRRSPRAGCRCRR